MELNATIQTYSEANKQIEDISDESSSSSKELAQNHGLTKFNEENSFWKSASETWQGFSEHYQKIAAENAENLKLCSDKAKMQEETIEELNALLDQNIKQKNLLEFLKNHYKDCWERQSYYC
uniref:Uncharacterized protein n=1 Tax=Panagrolaimus superbus TaxID=310955 RepID=A0A914YYT7_9BILA